MVVQIFRQSHAPFEEIEPIHVRQYLDLREAKTRANREKALFSHIWNKAREWGYTNLPKPCVGIKGHKEKGRKDVYVADDTYYAVYESATPPLRDAMDLASLTGQAFQVEAGKKNLPHRDEQFKNIERIKEEYRVQGNPVMSMDVKKKN